MAKGKLGIKCKTCGHIFGPKMYTAAEVNDLVFQERKLAKSGGVEDAIAAVQEHCDHKPERDRLNCDCKMFEAIVREKTGVTK